MDRTPITIELPEEIRSLVDGNVFNAEGHVQDDMLVKILAYLPEVIRIYGMAVTSLKKTKKDLELEKELKEAKLLLTIDPNIYKNDAMRGAKIMVDEEIISLKKEILEIDNEISEAIHTYMKYKNMLETVKEINKQRDRERRY